MKYAIVSTLILLCSPAAKAADCIYYEHKDRTGESISLNAPSQVPLVQPVWNDRISSVWVRSGFYSLVTRDLWFRGAKLYIYGSGVSFNNNAWQFDKAKNTGDGGVLFDLALLGFDEASTSLLCLKE